MPISDDDRERLQRCIALAFAVDGPEPGLSEDVKALYERLFRS